MKNVLFVVQHLDAGGTEKSLINICENIDKNKFHVSFFICDSRYNYLENYVKNLNVEIYKGPYINGLINKAKFLFSLYNLMQRKKFDVIHSNMGMFDLLNLTVAKLCKVPIRIAHAHNTSSNWVTCKLKKHIVNLFRVFVIHITKLVATDRIGCSSMANEYYFGSVWQQHKNTLVIYNGVNVEQFETALPISVCHKDEFAPQYRLITIGRISMAKNPIFIANIVLELSKIRQDFVLWWIGVGGYANEVKKFLNKHNIEKYVVFLGMRDDIPQLLKSSDLFILPSLFEGLPIVAVEAQLSGLNCFVSDHITSEVNIGKCRTLSLDLGARYWAESINDYIQQGTKLLIDENKKKEFDIKNTVRQIEKIYGR